MGRHQPWEASSVKVGCTLCSLQGVRRVLGGCRQGGGSGGGDVGHLNMAHKRLHMKHTGM